MMNGRLLIDGHDAYTEYGVYVEEQGWNELIAFPPLKAYDSNDWQEEDGIEADLTSPVLDTKEAQVNFATGDFSLFCAFIDLLSDGAYHTFNIVSLGRSYRLRLTQQPNMDYAKSLSKATLKFADDFPLLNYSYLAPQSTIIASLDYEIDNIPTTAYGVTVLQGTMSEVTKIPQVKLNLLRNIRTQSGAIYDNDAVTFKAKDVKLDCLMRAENLSQLWRNWDALLYNLTQSGERILCVNEIATEFPVCYKDCQVQEFYPDTRPWLKFTLTVTFLHDFRITDDAILSTEDGYVVFTEDNEYAIDLNVINQL
jgi:hypothetical protein